MYEAVEKEMTKEETLKADNRRVREYKDGCM